jgi:hypothetical protein
LESNYCLSVSQFLSIQYMIYILLYWSP